ncbi:hypothetical protein Ae201684P_001627 [Aphanomyces euteiches]|uniref:Rhodanese domain-containing protein n=1 Tax=Aphanomyces euteiches TaxID=100861 RepID=A0A6G0X969_9STRA|nr:hypothetical protein Ae201684_007060 [Aphanomyces euteiches]KAH9052447.1 hypothetical protein Ae201684P_001627 [Aphanomyces euteiches]KAH9157379.1 hypothetical protein AeRB84_000797 [Aphanomyces euteiches]
MSTFDDIFGDTSDLMGSSTLSNDATSSTNISMSIEGLGLDDLNLGEIKPSTDGSASIGAGAADPSDFLDWLDQKPSTASIAKEDIGEEKHEPSISDADMFTLDDTPVSPSSNPFAAPPSNPVTTPAPVAPAPLAILKADTNVFSASPPMPASSKQPTPQHSNTQSELKAPSPPTTSHPPQGTGSVPQQAKFSSNKAPMPAHASSFSSQGNPSSLQLQGNFSSNKAPPPPVLSSPSPPHTNEPIQSTPPEEIVGGSRVSSFEAFTTSPRTHSGASLPSTEAAKVNDNMRAAYRGTNKIPPPERLNAWTVLLEAKSLDPVTIVTHAAAASDDMKKDAQAICSILFNDATFCNLLKQEGVPVDAARLSMTDGVEQVLRAFCAHHKLTYAAKLGTIYTPLLALSNADPLRSDIFGLLDAVTLRLIPAVVAHIPHQIVADARRPLLKLLLLYHDPVIALHLDHTLPQWSEGTSGIVPDSWVSSLFEGSDHTDTMPLQALSNIWDCCIVNANSTYPSIIGLFIVLHAILQSKKRLLSLTNATTLRTVMMQLLVETLSQSPQLMEQVHELIEKTPFSFCTKLCDAGMDLPSEKPSSRTNSSSSMASPRTSSKERLENANPSMAKLGASLSSINSKFFAGASKLTASIMPGKHEHDKPSSRSESFHLETTAVYFSMTISACEVIPSVFRGFRSTSAEKIRYFIVDCRPEEYLSRGRIPTSFAFNSESLMDPSAFDAVMATLQPMKSSVHICILGHGYARHANHLIKDLNIPKSLVADMLAKDAAQVNDAVMFLTKRGFPYVSVVEGGYASAHRFLSKSRLFSLSDLTDHDPKQCDLCQQDIALKNKGRTSSSHSDEEDEYIQRTEGGVCLGRFGPDGRRRAPTPSTPRPSTTSPSTASSYFSSMTNALKDSTKTMAAVSSKTLKAVPGSEKMSDALKNSGTWMMKKTESMSLNDVSTSMTSGMKSVVDVAANPATMLKKAANSFASSLGNADVPMIPPTSPQAAAAAVVANPSVAAKKPSAKEAVFSIDDDEEEEADSFIGGSEPSDDPESHPTAPVIVPHSIQAGGIHELKKGMQIRMPELLPLVSSPLFSCYKKKARGSDTLMLPRYVVIAEGHIIVLKADKVQEDVSYVRSCHHLSHIARMTCMKKNALMVTLYLSFDSKQKQKSYEVQQRDAFIKVVRTSMEALVKDDEV